MSAYVLLNLLNELRKKDKYEACRTFYLFFCNEFNKFNNTAVQMLDSIHHITLKLFKNHIFSVKSSRFCHLLRNVIMDVITLGTYL